MVNVLNNKYGTVSGYSVSKTTQRPIIINKTNGSYFGSGIVGQNNQTEATMLANLSNNNVSSAAEAAAQALANSRLRAINRSFRTAVDKSFDMPSNSGKSSKRFFCFVIVFY
jgi:ABC-type phosphate transport system substrate-binding protein